MARCVRQGSDRGLSMDYLETARHVINIEIDALQQMRQRLNSDFSDAVQAILASQGRVVVIGMGKSGIIGRKISASLASTGTPAFSVHAGEAFHGDLGMIRAVDIALMISNSGETEELIRLLPFLQYQKNLIIAMTGRLDSTLAKHADFVLDVAVAQEACSNNLAPTSSTTATLVMGDALTVALSDARNFQPEEFARFHPGGSLGRKLLTRVADVMHARNLPICAHTASFLDVVHTITRGRLGLAIVMDGARLCGIVTDGDVRRALEKGHAVVALTAVEFMTASPKTILQDERLTVAEDIMQAEKIKELIVLDQDERVVGVLQIFDID